MPYRSSYDSPFGGFSVTPWVKRLLIANTAVFVAMFVLDVAAGGLGSSFAAHWLMLDRRAVLTQPWTLLTYAFVHAGIWHLLFNMLGLFFFGPPLEERWGSRAFIKFYAVAVAGGALAALLMPYPVVGASAGIYGVMLAYAMIWPDNQVYVWGIFPVKVKWLVVGLVLFSLYALRGDGGMVSNLAHLGGFASAFLYMKSPWAPSGWGDVAAVKRKKPRAMAWRGSGPRHDASVRPAAPQPIARKDAARMERDLLDDVDRILDKISHQGLASLTAQEKERLNEVSKRYRTN